MLAGDDAVAVVRRFVEEVVNGRNLDLSDELVAPDHVNHDPTAPETGRVRRASRNR